LGYVWQYKHHRYWTATIADRLGKQTSHWRDNKTPLYESLAAACALWQFILDDRNTDCNEIVFFADNPTPIAAWRSGGVKSEDCNQLLSGVLKYCAQKRITLIILWCPSHLNLSDAPSRVLLEPGADIISKMKQLADMQFIEQPFVAPQPLKGVWFE